MIDDQKREKEKKLWNLLSRYFVESINVQQAHQQAIRSTNDDHSGGGDRRYANTTNKSRSHYYVGQRQGRHFLTLVHRQGTLWELDGRRDAPTRLGTTHERTFWMDAMVRVQEILESTRDPSIHARCCLMALVPKK